MVTATVPLTFWLLRPWRKCGPSAPTGSTSPGSDASWSAWRARIVCPAVFARCARATTTTSTGWRRSWHSSTKSGASFATTLWAATWALTLATRLVSKWVHAHPFLLLFFWINQHHYINLPSSYFNVNICPFSSIHYNYDRVLEGSEAIRSISGGTIFVPITFTVHVAMSAVHDLR